MPGKGKAAGRNKGDSRVLLPAELFAFSFDLALKVDEKALIVLADGIHETRNQKFS
jgi:hypothetical protein